MIWYRFGVVCAFVSNEQLKEGIDELPQNLKNAVKDSDTFLNTTRYEVDHILGESFQQFQGALLNVFESIPHINIS